MRVEFKGTPPFYDYSLTGSTLSIGGQSFDLAALQEDSEKIIDIKDSFGNFIANIILPPADYELVDTGMTDEQGFPVYEKRKLPLNLAKVRLIVWPKKEVPQEDLFSNNP